MNSMLINVELGIELHGLTEADIQGCGFSSDGNITRQSHATEIRVLTPVEKAHLRAASYWLNIFQREAEIPHIEKVQGFLETAYHLRNMKAWSLLSQLLYSPTFHEQLETCGLYQEQSELYKSLLEQDIPELESICLDKLGHIHILLCNYPKAIQYFERLSQLATLTETPELEAKSVGGLGMCYAYWGKHQTAMECCKKHLELLSQLEASNRGDTSLDKGSIPGFSGTDKSLYSFRQVQKCRTYGMIGFLTYYQKQFSEAMFYCKKALAIADAENDSFTQWKIQGKLALIYSQLGRKKEAIAILQNQYSRRHQNYNTRQVCTMLLDLGIIYLYQRKFLVAMKLFQELLDLAQGVADYRATCYALMLLGFIEYWQEKPLSAINKLQKAINIAKRFDYQYLEYLSLSFLSITYSNTKDVLRAIQIAKQAIEIERNGEVERFQSMPITALGIAYLEKGALISGLCLIVKSLVMFPPWQTADGKLMLAVIIKYLFNKFSRLIPNQK